MTLPAAGRAGDPPVWPLPKQLARERALWADLWRKPQALMWEQNGQELEVALYVRRFVEAEQRSSPVNLSTLVRQMGDSLGLTTPGMRANRWKIGAAEIAVAEQSPSGGSPSARERFRVVTGDAAG